jgi:hypothetical protein
MILEKIRRWRKKRKEEADMALFLLGFEKAMSDYFLFNKTLTEINSHPFISKKFGTYTQFDAGTEEAVHIIRKRLMPG